MQEVRQNHLKTPIRMRPEHQGEPIWDVLKQEVRTMPSKVTNPFKYFFYSDQSSLQIFSLYVTLVSQDGFGHYLASHPL